MSINKEQELKECCYEAVFGSETRKLRRLGRCHYICDYCGNDVSLLWAFYQLSLKKDEQRTSKKVGKTNTRTS